MEKIQIGRRTSWTADGVGQFPGLPGREFGVDILRTIESSGIHREPDDAPWNVKQAAKELAKGERGETWAMGEYKQAETGKMRAHFARLVADDTVKAAHDLWTPIRWYVRFLALAGALGVAKLTYYEGGPDAIVAGRKVLGELLGAWRVLRRRYMWAARAYEVAEAEAEAERKAARSAAGKRGAATRAAARGV